LFDALKRELERINKSSVGIPIEADADGFIDTGCPNEECKYQFKVQNEDWTNIFKDEAVYCPLCGHSSPADTFWRTEQLAAAKEEAFKYVEGRISKAIDSDAENFNRSQPRNSFIKFSMQVKGDKPQLLILPISSTEELKLKIQCEKCGSRYAVVGCGYFCPGCGYNSIERLFQSSLQKISAKLNNVETIRIAISQVSADEAEITCRSLIESALSDCVVAFQKINEHMYKKLPSAAPSIPFNVFQRIDDGSLLWKSAIGEGFDNWLTPNELADMKLYFQRRHLLAHAEGIVDERYLKNTGDTRYKLGQKIVVKPADIERTLELVKKVSEKINEKT